VIFILNKYKTRKKEHLGNTSWKFKYNLKKKMKLIAALLVLIVACTIQNTIAVKKVTASITVTGLTAAEINDKKDAILGKIATLLDVDVSAMKAEGDAAVSTATTGAPTTTTTTAPTTTASPVSAAPGRRMYDIELNPIKVSEGAGRRRLNAVVFTFSVIVANAADATAMKTKLESANFQNGLVTQLGSLYTGKTIAVNVATPAIDNYTPPTTTAGPKKKASVDAGFPLAMPSKVVQICIGILSIAMVW
jgi:hypothetical protein